VQKVLKNGIRAPGEQPLARQARAPLSRAGSRAKSFQIIEREERLLMRRLLDDGISHQPKTHSTPSTIVLAATVVLATLTLSSSESSIQLALEQQ